ncbi:MAG: molybdopterin cofactor-binding domain-containing protein [Bacteroidota bacterium]
MSTSSLSRRTFLRNSGLSGVGLLIGLYLPTGAKAEFFNGEDELVNKDIEMCAWIIISTTGQVTIIDHRAEMGQGSHQSVPQIVAEELEVDLKDVHVQFGQGDKKYGSQITGGSSTIRSGYKKLLNLSATAREMLITAAAAKWGTTAAECYAKSGHVYHKPSGKKLHYGELVEAASKLETPKNVALKKRLDYKLIGKPLLRNDTPMKTNGTAIFGIDKRVPGMVFAAVERNPRLRGKVKSYDDSAALKVPGVQKVFKVRMAVWNTYREGVAVVANSTWAAFQGKKALKVEWDDSGFEHINTPDIYKRHREYLQDKEGLSFKKQGDVNGVLEKAAKKLDVIYETPYQSHSAIEPMNCVVHYQGDKIEVWGPLQAPDWIQDHLSKEFGIAREKVIVNMTFLGGGFGRKAFTDYPHEAAVISKEIGKPVQVVWTREDDVIQGPYRPGMSYRCEGAIENGAISALKFRMAGQNNDHWMVGDSAKTRANRSTSEGFLEPYYASIPNISFAEVPFETPIPTIFWRSVYASTNGFAYESFMDELAIEAGKDPLAFRRQHLKEERCQHLIDKMEEVSGWKSKSKNSGYGAAITECFKSTVGHVVKVSKGAGGKIQIDNVWAVMDCGWYVNPDIIRAQVEGSIIMALGAATMHEITFKDGLTEQRNYYNYHMPRIHDIPPIEVFIMENNEDAGGVGEPGLPPFAPALTNAIFDLTGKRIRKLPFNLATV